MPISQILSNGKVRIFNSKTGQTADVAPEELGNYSPALVGQYQQISATRDAIKSGQIKTSDVPDAQKTTVASALSAAGYSPEKAAKQTAADQQRHDNLQAAISSLDASEQNLQTGGGAQGIMGATANIPLVGQWLNPAGDAYNKTKIETATQLAKAITNSARPGQSVTDAYMHSLPEVTDNPEHAKDKIALMRNQLQAQAKAFGYQDLIDQQKGQQAPTPPASAGNSLTAKLLQNAGSDLKGVANGAINMPIDAAKGVVDDVKAPFQGKIDPASIAKLLDVLRNPANAVENKVAENVVPNTVSEYNQALGKPLEGGDVIGRIGQHAVDHPVNTILDALPFLAGAKASMGGKVQAPVDEAVPTQTMTPKPNPLQQILRVGADSVNGGGSKEYIARTAGKDTAIPQNQALMDEGILLHPTETGRIQATQGALKKYGGKIGEAYTNSDRVFKGDELNKKLDQGLRGQGYDDKSIQFIKNYINQQGGFDLASGDNLITMDKAWKSAKTLENNPPKMLKNPESGAAYKKLSTDAARIIRGSLGEKVPETKGLNARYSALRDYMDSKLPDVPQGIKTNDFNSTITAPAQVAKAGVNVAGNALYKALGIDPRKLVRDKRMTIDNPNALRPVAKKKMR